MQISHRDERLGSLPQLQLSRPPSRPVLELRVDRAQAPKKPTNALLQLGPREKAVPKRCVDVSHEWLDGWVHFCVKNGLGARAAFERERVRTTTNI
jgi:hypothetical protein